MRRAILALVVLWLVFTIGPACDDYTYRSVAERLGVDEGSIGEEEPVPPPEHESLSAVAGCEDLEQTLREALIEAARRSVLAERRNALNYSCYEGGSGGFLFGCSASDGEMMGADMSARGDEGGSSGGGASEYSTTNTQEQGVDEADFIKNDGEYIYIAAANEFQIIRAYPAEEMRLVSTFPLTMLEGPPRNLYVYGDHAVIYSYQTSPYCSSSYNYGGWYGYGCMSRDTTTLVTVLDLTDRENPALERTTRLQGTYVSSRRIDGSVHTVVALPAPEIAGLQYRPARWDYCSYQSIDELESEFAALIESNTRIISEATLDAYLPTIVDTRYLPDGSMLTRSDLYGDCEDILVPERVTDAGILTVLSFDMLEPGNEPNVASIFGEQGVVYASSESLYVASADNVGWGVGAETTTVHRFALSSEPAAATYQASGWVGGRVLNQFSMSEHEGYLRMATTTGYLPSPDAFNSVFVLGQRGDELVVTGEVTPIAPTEDIRSARFDGDRGFIVTFKKTDPLFVLDLRDPENPHIEGELHIPGFSTYMHMMDEDHLLSIGYDADDQGDFAWFTGIQLQIFDISDMSDPRREHRHLIGTRGTSSEAATNHLAFNYFGQRDLLALPMAICAGGGDGGMYGDEMTFNGLMVFDVTTEHGFHERGRIAHPIQSSGYDYYGGSCYHWWSDPVTNGVRRSVIMDDYVYSVASDRIIAAGLGDLSTPISSIALPTQTCDYYGYCY